MTTGRSFQRCPVCSTQNDVSVYVSGQKARCAKCGIAFVVARPDIPSVSKPPSQPSRPAAGPPPIPAAPAAVPPADETQVLASNPVVPGYEILEVIGKGGMGTVYKGRQISLDREVAIKVLARELASDKDFIERFDREASALAKLSHPNIVPIIDKGSHEGVYYFVMDYVQGNTLRDLLRGNRIPQDTTIKITLQVCRAIAHAHANGVVHRDMKPENVLLDREQNVRIADFGLADIVGTQTWGTLTGSNMAMGTAHYMAPEQRRDAKRVDLRADIYSMGIMIYEMLTGEIPAGHFKRPSEQAPGVNAAFDKITIRCLQMAPEDRYQAAEELARDLRSAFPAHAPDQTPLAPPVAPAAPPKAPAPGGDRPPAEPAPPPRAPAADADKAPAGPPAAPRAADPDKKTARAEKADIRPISVRLQKRHQKIKLAAFGVGVALLVVLAIVVAKSCL
jgi:serine/threonine-protein kinase